MNSSCANMLVIVSEIATDAENIAYNSCNEDQCDGGQSPDTWEAMSKESSDLSSESASKNSNSILSEYVSSIKTILDQLIRITLAIKKSGNRTRFEDIDSACEYDEYQEFFQLLVTVVLRAHGNSAGLNDARQMSAHDTMMHFSDLERLSPVQRRLIRNNILRRNRFNIFRSKHHEQQVTAAEIQNVQLSVARPDDSGENPGLAPSTPQSSVARSSPKVPQRSIVSRIADTATEPGSSLDINHIVNNGVRSAATKMTRVGSSQVYPPCPLFRENEHTICPYCCEQLPSNIACASDESAWK